MSTCYSWVVGVHIDPELRFTAGVAWLDLLVTVGQAYGPAPVERLRGLPQLVAWLDHEGLAPEAEPVESDVADARALREALRPVVLATLDDRPVTTDELAALAPWLADATPPRPVLRAGRLALEPPPTTRAALADLATRAVAFLAGPDRAHLGACADPLCRMAFLDPTGRRRWCSPDTCGVRTRVRNHRARAKGTVPDRSAGDL
jgi:predicted RNA-binding Zn ribbon-like protein